MRELRGELRYGHCDACPCPGSPRIVYGTGPASCQYLALGAGPGKTENQTLRAYSGLAGQEWDNTYLPLAGLDRETLAADNCTKCWDGTDRPVPGKRIQSCARWHLPQLLADTQPEVLILMGGAACKIADPIPAADGDYQRLRLDLHRGIPQWGSVLGGVWSGWIWPMFEPALGMRDTPRMEQLLEDWTNFGKWRRGEWRPPQPGRGRLEGRGDRGGVGIGAGDGIGAGAGAGIADRELDYRLVRTPGELYEYLDCPAARLEQGLDTENHGPVPFSIQISHTPGTARMMLWRDQDVIRAFAEWVEGGAGNSTDWYMHKADHDLDWCDKMGVHIPEGRYYDTLQEAYHLCALPQGLKPLSYRLFGMLMRSWEDVVLPASRNALVGWAREGIALAERDLTDVEITRLARGRCTQCKHVHGFSSAIDFVCPTCKAVKGQGCVTAKGKASPKLHVKREKLGLVNGYPSVKVCRCGCRCQEVTLYNSESKPGALEKILRHVVRYAESTVDADEPYDAWKALARMRGEGLRGGVAEEWEWGMIERELGKVPILGIGNCDLIDARDYACGDSDFTLRVARELRRRRASERWIVDKSDWDLPMVG